MLETLRYRWTSKEIKGAALGVLLLAAFVLLTASGFWSSRGATQGVVLSTGPASVASACGGTRELASVQLSSGRIVYAFVASGGPLHHGTPVTVRKQWSPCNTAAYEAVASP